MKKIFTTVLALALALSLTACRNGSDKKPTETTAAPTTTAPSTAAPTTSAPTTLPTMPSMDPTMGTNIPDPSVDSTNPNATEGTGSTGTTDTTDATNATGARIRRSDITR